MDENGIAAVMEAADSGWAVAALFLVMAFLLLWKFGNDIIALLKENTAVTREANATAEHISKSIVTNHGSKNLGDAIDRLTSEVWSIRDNQAAMQEQLNEHLAATAASKQEV